MEVIQSERGFRFLMHPPYEGDPRRSPQPLVSESAAVGGYADSMDRPGSSFLFIGDGHHLNREQVAQLRDALTHWLTQKRLPEVLQ